jgi:adenylyltransferase/sulfurtransferase
MSVNIHIPTVLRQFTGSKSIVTVSAETIGESLEQLTKDHPILKKHLYNEKNELRNFVNIYLNDKDIRYLNGLDTKVTEDADIIIVPSIAGGSTDVLSEPGLYSEAYLPELDQEEVKRYSRHLILSEVGLKGQRILKNSKVLVVGTGGLGAPVGLYLAAAGIGHIGLVDFDVVDESNLQRQVIHSTSDVGKPKIQSAAKRLQGINPKIHIETYETRLTSENALDIIKDYDVVVDGTDNFPTRYLVNDACVLLGKPNVYGSIFQFEGQVSVFWAKKGACYRCLYSEPPPSGLVPSCAEGGVLGVLPGIIGSIQANETIKILLGIGKPLINRLLLFDALNLKFRELSLKKNPQCPICGENPSIHQLIDYEEFCDVSSSVETIENSVEEIDVEELSAWLRQEKEFQLVDVREPFEFDIAKLPSSRLIPLAQVVDRVAEINPSISTVVFCKGGVRSLKAITKLKEHGYTGELINLKGGITAWSNEIDSSVPKY